MATRVVVVPLDAVITRVRYPATGNVFAVLSTGGPVYVSFAESGGDEVDFQARGDKLVTCRPMQEIFISVREAVAAGELRLLVSDELNMGYGAA